MKNRLEQEKPYRVGLKFKIIVPIIVLNVVVFISQLLVFQESIQDSITKEFTSKGRAVVQSLSTSVQDTILNRDASTIQGFIDQYRGIQGVEYIFIQNEKDEIIAHTFHPEIPRQFLEKGESESENGDLMSDIETREAVYDGYRVIHVRAPILAGLLGKVSIGMGIEKEEREVLWPLVLKSFLFRGILALLGISISVLILSRALTPLVKLKKKTQEIIDSKDLNVSIESNSRDEVGDLANAFNVMVKELRHYTENLENLVTERTKELEETKMSLVNSTKLSALGEMAGGVAHEINNPLAIITGYSQRLIKKIDRGDFEIDEARVTLNKIQDTTDRIAKIVKSLRVFSRQGQQDPFYRVTVGKVVESCLDLCKEKFKIKGIELRVEGQKDIEFECREVQIGQILVNLLNNAHDAVEGLRERWVELKWSTTDSDVVISVTDSGNGIPKDLVEKIMEPFFTTKEVGKGTGLGLSVSAGIIKSHGGVMKVDESCSHTRFVIQIPMTQPKEGIEKRSA